MAIPSTTGAGRRTVSSPLWLWLLPPLVAALARYQPDRMVLGINVLVALGVVSLVARRPQPALLTLVALLPFQQVVLATALRLGVPAAIVRDLGFWKEAVVVGCVVAALQGLRCRGRKFDAVDVLGLVYVGIVGLYFLFPRLFVHPSGPLAVGPPTDASTLLTALRNDTVFVVLLLAVRRLPLDAGFRRRFVTTLLAVGTVVAAIGMFESVFSNAWNHFIVSTLQVPRYLSSVLNVSVRNPLDIRVYSQVGGHDVLRIGSVFLDQLACGLYLVIALAIGLERLARGDRRLVTYLTTSLLGVAILLTQTRAAVVAAIVVIACTLRPSIERRDAGRPRYAFLVAVGLLAFIPLTVATGLAARSAGVVAGEESARLHIDRTRSGTQALLAAPLGRGLGTGNINGTRFLVANTLNAENYYLQVGNETGLISMAVFLALVLILNRRLRRLVLGRSSVLVSSWRGVFLGLSVAALLNQVWWLGLAVAWTVWAGAGVCLGLSGGPAAGSAGRASTTDARRFLSAPARRWPLILATAAAAVLATPHTHPPDRRFTAQSTLVVGLRQFLAAPGSADPYIDLTSGLDRQRQVYAEAVTGGSLTSDAVARAGVARAPTIVAAETAVSSPPGTQLLRIAVTDTDPAVARSLADGLAQALIAGAPGLQEPNRLAAGATADLSVTMAGPAVVSPVHQPVGPKDKPAGAAVFGLLAAIGAVIVIEYVDLTIRDVNDIERRLDVPVLATITGPDGPG